MQLHIKIHHLFKTALALYYIDDDLTHGIYSRIVAVRHDISRVVHKQLLIKATNKY